MHRFSGDPALNEAVSLGVTAASMLTAGHPEAALASVRAFVAHVRALNLLRDLPRGTPVFAYALEAAMYVAGHFRMAAELEELLQLMRALTSFLPMCTMLYAQHEATLDQLTLERLTQEASTATPMSTGAPTSPAPLTSLNTDCSAFSPAWEDPLAALDVPSPPLTLQSVYE